MSFTAQGLPIAPVAMYDPVSGGAAALVAPDGLVPAGSPFTASSLATLWQGSVVGYGSIEIIPTSIPGTLNLILEAAGPDGNWFTVPVAQIAGLGGNSQLTFNNIWVTGFNRASTFGTQMRLRVNTYSSGTVTAAVVLRRDPFTYPNSRAIA